jgi:hypothetical protein
VPLPDRDTIKSDLASLIRERGIVSPSEAYVALADNWGLTSEERARIRGGRSLYEHEIRWARQELVLEGVLQPTDVAGRAAWQLADPSTHGGAASKDGSLSRMITGFLDPHAWFLSQWLPQYESTVREVKRAIEARRTDAAIELVWRQKDNSVSNAGQGVMAAQEIDAHIDFFRSITLDIASDPSPKTFDKVLADATRQQSVKHLSKIPRLLIARAFATISPDRYHTTVDSTKHERVVDWFEKHTTFRSTAGNWAHRAAELGRYLGGLKDLGDSVFVRNMFPWFVFTQLEGKDGRPAFTPGHKSRVLAGTGTNRIGIETINLRHNLLVETLYAELVDEYGRKVVGTEQPSGLGGFVDAVVKLGDARYWIYEVKVATTASEAIRQALGQLLEYAFREGAWNPQKIFVVGEPALDEGSRRFLSRLRSQFELPVEYRQVIA